MCERCEPAELLRRNLAWAESYEEEDPEYFQRLASQQNPNYLWIGCSDSRVPANDVVGLEAGELFVHRNVANQVVHTDFNGLSAAQFAIDHLKVEHVIICGHYGCGGVKAAMENSELGIVDNWLRSVKDIYCRNLEEIEALRFRDQQLNRLCELNVIEQVRNLCKTKVVQRAWRNGRKLTLHGWIYSLTNGRITDLNIDMNAQKDLEHIYWMSPLEP